MSDNILISIIVPLYNDELYMDKMLDSVLNQTYKNYELIFIDDGSTDKGVEKIKHALSNGKFRGLRYTIIEKENGGASSARNEGIRLAKGKYLYFLDSDDYIEKDLCQTIYNSQIKDDLDFISFRYDIVKKDTVSSCSEVYNGECSNCEDVLRLFLLDKIKINMCSFVVKNEILKKYNLFFTEGSRYGEDTEFIIKSLYNCKKAKILNDIKFHYFINEHSTVEKFDLSRKDSILSALRSENYIKQYTKNQEILKLMKKNVARKLMYNLEQYVRLRNKSNLDRSQRKEFLEFLCKYRYYLDYLYYGDYENITKKINRILIKINPIIYIKTKYLYMNIKNYLNKDENFRREK